MDYQQAIDAMETGADVAREAWGGSMRLVHPSRTPGPAADAHVEQRPERIHDALHADGQQSLWHATDNDVAARDWVIA